MKVNSQKMRYLVRLHGYVCGDGSANFYSYSHRKPKAHLNIKIDDQACLNKIIEAFAGLNYSPNILEARGKNGAWFTVQAQKGKIVREILSLGPVGSYGWRMPDLQKPWIREWIMVFFDSDATVTCVNKEITVESVNQAGLSHLRIVLAKNFGIYSHLKFRRDRRVYLLRICGKENLERFYNKIGFYHQRKQEKLHSILSSYQKYYGESWTHLKAQNRGAARRVLMDVFGHRGYFRAKAGKFGSFELGSHNPQAIAKIANMLRHYFGIKCTLSTHDNQDRSWVRISRRNELRKLLLFGLLANTPRKEAAIGIFLSRYN